MMFLIRKMQIRDLKEISKIQNWMKDYGLQSNVISEL